MRYSLLIPWLLFPALVAAADDAELRNRAAAALRRSVEFFSKEVSSQGGYVWKYSPDLSRREGEGKATSSTVECQPPGTPSVGRAYLAVYRDTGDKACLQAALAAGYCLARGQVKSGGWAHTFELDPAQRALQDYRIEPAARLSKKTRNISTLDDNTTQECLRFLMELDQALEFKDAQIHDTVVYALEALLKAQYPGGGWAQVYDGPVDPANHPAQKASLPEDWPRTYPGGPYWFFYTFNDNAHADAIDTMFLAHAIYKEQRYYASAIRGADFILLAQLPEPQPAWAQQYNPQMQPAWARKFEPPAVTASESQRLLRVLMSVYARTGDKKYLDAVAPALAYLKKCVLPDGRLARFYELKTSKPLYMTRDYKLTYNGDDTPTHYAFKVGSDLEKIEKEYQRLVAADPKSLAPRVKSKPEKASAELKATVKKVIAGLDDKGRWVESGTLRHSPAAGDTILDSATFARNIRILGQYLGTTD